MRLFHERERLKLLNISNLTEAYAVLAAPVDDPVRFIPSWAKPEYGIEEMNSALEILGYALDAAARQGTEVSVKDRIVFVFLLLEKRLRITSEGECERFDGERWHRLTSSLDLEA